LTLSLYYEDMEPTRGFSLRKKKKTLMRKSRRHLKSSHATTKKTHHSDAQMVIKLHKKNKLRESENDI